MVFTGCSSPSSLLGRGGPPVGVQVERPQRQRGRTTLTPTRSTACLIGGGGEDTMRFRSCAASCGWVVPAVLRRAGAQTYLGPRTQRSGDMMRMGCPACGRSKGAARSVFSGRPPRTVATVSLQGAGRKHQLNRWAGHARRAFQAAWCVGVRHRHGEHHRAHAGCDGSGATACAPRPGWHACRRVWRPPRGSRCSPASRGRAAIWPPRTPPTAAPRSPAGTGDPGERLPAEEYTVTSSPA